ncbi:hypothetical protein MBOU_31020 [Mycobacterium bourgelatii]|uniref:Uncharacterized protein n=1 Tax=Mycobacterium bourgelatii TaxID=1273442 RepID=A0A7I9YQV9_MYCBU|nr:hypothetical protein MBOU_31020 [Mycobacterium bourgelatii]
MASVGVGIEQAGQIPASVGGKIGDDVATLGDHLPQRLRRVDPARETARHAHDGDGLAGALQQRTVGAFQAFNLDQRFSQRFGCMLELVNHH